MKTKTKTKTVKPKTEYEDCPNTPNWYVCRASNPDTTLWDKDGRALLFLTRNAARKHCLYAGEVVRQESRR